MVRVVEYVREKVIVYVGDQLRRRGIVGGVRRCRLKTVLFQQSYLDLVIWLYAVVTIVVLEVILVA